MGRDALLTTFLLRQWYGIWQTSFGPGVKRVVVWLQEKAVSRKMRSFFKPLLHDETNEVIDHS